MSNKKKIETLQSALEGRNSEIEEYQINIENYTRAIKKINAEHGDNQPILEFRDNLSNLLESHKIEQLKSIIIRDVIAEQINEMEGS